ncbi:MAG: type I-C CRISPR-associated protein Cas8c/Csd1 [Hyphomicrobium sp. 32-62-53]|nr:MAG: type I-C CRISPR-associated protein Cas8c/Csd1 [Hyphomicrobium sp. 12-62-95]OYY01766.1 MAG: type I-C CRISPR-associated protein Cas8c/Csd1 [Hyphomicrobium sp. 32-62-53]
MTILQSLVALYERLERRGETIPRQGYAPVRIGFVLELNSNGEPLSLIDIRDHTQRKPLAPKLLMPAVSRTSGIKPAFLWDKTSYVFGVTGLEGGDGRLLVPGQGKRTLDEHDAFRKEHCEALAGLDDEGLRALYRFLNSWSPDKWQSSGFSNDALDQNIAFRLKGDFGRLDERDAARDLIVSRTAVRSTSATCLITGEVGPISSLQPQLKGVAGAQSSGAPLVSFNASAFESYDLKQGANAPVSEEAAFKYGAALNWLLDRAHSRSFRLGETTVVFWADQRLDAGDGVEADAAEDDLWAALGGEAPKDADAAGAAEIGGAIQDVKTLRRAPNPKLQAETRVHILGLSPNAGRIAVRFWLVDSFGHLKKNLDRHKRDMEIKPPPRNPDQKAFALLYEVAVQRKAENIPPRVGGELARAILSGGRYPSTLLNSVVRRVRVDQDINANRAALCKAIINRDNDQEVIPVALDPTNMNAAYRLGRLFALIESAQRAALPGIKATVKDRFFGSACATPARVFPLLHKNAMNHLASIRKERSPGLAHWIEKEIGSIWSGLSDDLPKALRLEDQGRFIAGYYHQRFSNSDGASEAQSDLASEIQGDA